MDKAVNSSAPSRRRVVVLGSTGSIGTNCLDVVAHLPDRLEVVGLSAHSQLGRCCSSRPSAIGRAGSRVTDPDAAAASTAPACRPACELLRGPDGIAAHGRPTPTWTSSSRAIVGAAGLAGTWAALEAGKTVAVANKETLVMAGPLVMDLAARRGAPAPAGRQRAQRHLPGDPGQPARRRSSASC